MVEAYVADKFGASFRDHHSYNIRESFNDSSPQVPLVFLLSPGADPLTDIQTLAGQMKTSTDTQAVASVSLGQGQAANAERLIASAAASGTWVVLQNCHLMPSWLPVLERIVTKLSAVSVVSVSAASSAVEVKAVPKTPIAGVRMLGPRKKYQGSSRAGLATGAVLPAAIEEITMLHPKFRLWLTVLPTYTSQNTLSFPGSVLSAGVKLNKDTPRGLKANVIAALSRPPLCDAGFMEAHGTSTAAPEFRKLVYGTVMFHALAQERRWFGSLGWNIPYEFTDSDLAVSLLLLKKHVDSSGASHSIPTLQYLIGECFYGGRVTDPWDRRALASLLQEHLSADVLYGTRPQSAAVAAAAAPVGSEESPIVSFLRDVPVASPPEAFGLHPLAGNTKLRLNTSELLHTVQAATDRHVVQSMQHSFDEGETAEVSVPLSGPFSAAAMTFLAGDVFCRYVT